jgi:FAD/FMN-containing dehydrogenase
VNAPSTVSHDHVKIVDTLISIVGADSVVQDPEALKACGMDLFYQGEPPTVAIEPANVAELAEAVRVACEQGFAIIPRGAGLSYSAGTLGDGRPTVLVETHRLNQVLEINEEDMYVRVECGVTWKQLDDALRSTGLRTPFWGTGSGLHATVGSGLSYNVVNYGSARYGQVAESVLGLTVVLPSGRQLRTGSGASPNQPPPFSRYYGPDLSGLFLGDSGALGIKTEAVLRLIPRAASTRYAAFSFPTRDAFAAAMAKVGRSGLTSECFGFDPFFLSERIVSTGFADDVRKLLGVAKGQGSVMKGLKEALFVAAAGRRYAEGVGYTLHMSVDGRDDADADSAVGQVRRSCLDEDGEEIEASIPKIMRGTPFPPPAMVFGPKGESWVPVHCMLPHSRHLTALEAVDGFMDEHAELIERHGITWGQVSMLIGQSTTLVEINLYWQDQRTAAQTRYLDDAFLKALPVYAANPEARTAVGELRVGLAELFGKLGAAHVQIGRLFPFLENRDPELRDLLKSIKHHLDPDGRMNPGVSGL